MKNILMIGTGGTIASGQTADGLAPELDPSRLLQDTPRVAQLCRVDCLQLYSLDSTNIRPCHWLGLARAIDRLRRAAADNDPDIRKILAEVVPTYRLPAGAR